MSELLTKVLCNEDELPELIKWLNKNDITTSKDGISQIEFARFLLEFLRKHTRLLLPVQDQTVNGSCPDNDIQKRIHCEPVLSPLSACHQTPNSSFNANTSTPIRSKTSTPVNKNSTSISSRTSTPFNSTSYNSSFGSRNSSPFHSTGYNSSFGSNLQTPNCSPDSMKLLEKRLTSRDPKPLQLGDFLVTKEKQSKNKKKKRVSLVSCTVDNEKKTNSDIPFGKEVVSKVELDVKNNSDTKIMDEHLPQLKINLKSPDTEKNIQAFTQLKINHKKLLRSLAFLYSATISSNLIQDLLKELNYIISLLTVDSETQISTATCVCQCSKSSISEMFLPNTKEICLFRLKAEGTYFASIVLENQWNLLKYLNKSTLRLLSENSQLTVWVPNFTNEIKNYIQESKSDNRNVNFLNREMLTETVKFQMDNDCRPNYANDELFYAFKKQRDEFYSLLQEWEDSSQRRSSAEFFKLRYKRLRLIFTICSASTNMFRFADLFVSQILASVFNENVENCEKLSLSGIPMTKFDLLNRRFITPCSIVVGYEKRFPGVQEFFKDFLRTSSENAFFFNHVRDVLIQRIVSLNNFKFSCEVSVALEKQELFLVCINKLCLLAKFLSLITFLPYQDQYNLQPHLRIPLAEARKAVLPPLDLDYCLTNSINTGRMVITIPWIVEFLNGIDRTSILLPCYRTLLAKLQYFLYKIKLPLIDAFFDEINVVYSEDVGKLIESINVRDDGATNNQTNMMNMNKIKRLAQQCENDFIKRFANECIETINCSQILITFYINSLFNNVPIFTIIKMEEISSLKERPILMSSEFYIGETALYQCCPQLHEIKSLLEGVQKLSYKSVTPKTEKAFCERSTQKVAIDVLIETHFFDNMPKTVKKCVDFVAERIASQCVKSVCQKLIPKLRSTLSDELKKCLSANFPEDGVDRILATFYSTLRCGVKDELSKFCKNIEISLRALVAAEVPDENIMNICVDITCRKCLEIVYNWIFNYINFSDMVKKEREEVHEEMERQKSSSGKAIEKKKSKKCKWDLKKNVFEEWVARKDSKGMESSLAPVKILHQLRHVIRRTIGLMEYNDESALSQEELIRILDEVIDSVEHRPDLQFIAFRRILMLSLEVVTTLVFYSPELVTNTLLKKFNELWVYRKVCRLHLTFEQILSPRNMQLYLKLFSPNQTCIQNALTEYLVFTINNDILHVTRLYSQILRLLRIEWPTKLLTRASECLQSVLARCNTGHEKISFAIGWIADFIQDELE